jgi:SAM-dependent methyltransferase
MTDYHLFVFNHQKRKFIGRFEEMYQAEQTKGFDSWHQEDMRNLSYQICLLLINNYIFCDILDIGCGKGTFTHLLKKVNNRVVGIDISQTALNTGRQKFPDIEFVQVDLAKDNYKGLPFYQAHYDLVILMEILSYLHNWREVFQDLAGISHYALVSLYIPENPIGFVKSRGELLETFHSHFEVINDIYLTSERKTILFGRKK